MGGTMKGRSEVELWTTPIKRDLDELECWVQIDFKVHFLKANDGGGGQTTPSLLASAG